jgi:hypothetical protein
MVRFIEPRQALVDTPSCPRHTNRATGQFLDENHWIYLMSKKRLLAIIVWSATLAATGAIADVTHTP